MPMGRKRRMGKVELSLGFGQRLFKRKKAVFLSYCSRGALVGWTSAGAAPVGRCLCDDFGLRGGFRWIVV